MSEVSYKQNEKEFRYFFESNNSLFENYANNYEGDFEDYRILRCEYMKDPWSNLVIFNNDLDEIKINKLKEILKSENLTPSFYGPTESQTIELLEQMGAKPNYQIIWMKKDLKIVASGEKETSDRLKIVEIDSPNNSDYLKVFVSAYMENDGIGFKLDDTYLKPYEKHRSQPRFHEIILIAYVDEVPVCISSLGIDNEKTEISVLHSVGTSNDHRENGYARELMSQCISIARSRGISTMYLGTIYNSPMQSFYESLGFESFFRSTQMVFDDKK